MRTCAALDETLRVCPTSRSIVYPGDWVEVVSKVKGFVGLFTLILSILLLLAAILLIWNTIRTAMFARRREIEVMKLVGATDWFIRVPFMLEGLIQGLVGALCANAALWLINNRWTAGVEDFPSKSGLEAMVVDGDFQASRMLVILIIGMAAGAIGSGIAASRFLDVSTAPMRLAARTQSGEEVVEAPLGEAPLTVLGPSNGSSPVGVRWAYSLVMTERPSLTGRM